MSKLNKDKVFDYRALRLMVGLIALTLPCIVTIVSDTELTSISESYYTNARDLFVGMLFIVGAFLWAYNGHTTTQAISSKLASISAVTIALFPTFENECGTNLDSNIHAIAAVILFSILSYFCFVYFRENTKGKGGKKGLRSKIYYFCGSVMVGALVAIIYVKFAMNCEVVADYRIVYWAEAIALGAFGVAWIVAGKYFRLLVEAEEELILFARKL